LFENRKKERFETMNKNFCRINFCRLLSVLLLATLVCLDTGKANATSAELDKFGICDHLASNSDWSAACDEIIASGIKWVRMSPEWGSIQPASGEYSTTTLTRIDGIVNKLTSNGVNVVFILCYTAPWASSMPTSPDASRYKPMNWLDWENYVNFITTRYNNKIYYWEVWNEPDHSGFWKNSAQDYTTLLQKASNQIQLTNVNNKVLLGGLAMMNNFGIGGFFDTIMSQGAGSEFDIVNYHAYGDSTRFRDLYNGIQSVVTKYGISSKKIWVTETGFSSEGVAAKEVIKTDKVEQTYQTHFGLTNIERIFWYVHRNTSTSDPFEANFGLIKNDRTPLKAFYHYQAIGGAETDFGLQGQYPTLTPTRRTLNYVPATTGDGVVTNYNTGGTIKTVPTGNYMYFTVNDNWLYDGNAGMDTQVYVDVTFQNNAAGTWGFHYDATSAAYKVINQAKTSSGTWQTVTFALTDAKFANRQNYSADFRFYAISSPLNISKVVVRKDMNRANVVFGSPELTRYIEVPPNTDPTWENYTPLVTIGGEASRHIASNSKYIYVKVSDGFIRTGNTGVKIGFGVWDAGTDNILIQYNATGGVAHKSVNLAKTNTNTWVYKEIIINDADFRNAQSYFADFRIGNGYDNSNEYVHQIQVQKIS
jgi:hypothetical protein